jgi:molybdopterin-containing oxidoreductase family iron-sulfur binding subunit
MGNGSQANNPWLQELPDPLTRTCWDNYLTISKKTADAKGIKDGDIVKVEANGYSVEVPAIILPGQMANVFGLAIGYGRTSAGKAADSVGVNAYPFTTTKNGVRHNMASGVSVTKTGKSTQLAQTQTHHTIEGRDLVKESTLEAYIKDKAAGNIRPMMTVRDEHGKFEQKRPSSIKIWEGYEYNGHKWAMAIDLNACTGCGACVVACQAENNVPVVGKDEVIRRREMHWIRIDRYFSYHNSYKTNPKLAGGVEKEAITKEKEYNKITEEDFENIDVVFQPIMCMQCNNAPCETVCPVLATTHSEEGLNQMTYNRCVGTRYCANNCPYKVRRFNWFNYFYNDKFYLNPTQSELGKMVINPDVTVRARGVMEKCTFCVQRIQAGKLDGKRQGKRPEDGSIKTACQQTCPANAIVFGDVNDTNSEVHKLFKNERSYGLLEEVNTQPSVNYMTKIRNRKSTTNA